MGGFVYKFLECCENSQKPFDDNGVPILRYLGSTAKSLQSQELYDLGLLTHLVGEVSDQTVAMTYAHTVSDSFQRKSDQGCVVFDEGLSDLLDDIDINSDIDVPIEKMLSKTMHANGIDDEFTDITIKNDSLTKPLHEDLDMVCYCFQPDSISETIKRLSEVNNNWSKEVLIQMNKIDSNCLQVWFDLVRSVSRNVDIKESSEQEWKALDALVK